MLQRSPELLPRRWPSGLIVAGHLGTAIFLVSSFLGLLVTFKIHTVISYMVSAVGAVCFVMLLLNTKQIMENRSKPVYRIMMLFWGLSIIIGTYAIYIAGCRFIIMGNPILDLGEIDAKLVSEANSMLKLVMYGLIMFFVAAPVGVSYLLEPAPVNSENKPKVHVSA